ERGGEREAGERREDEAHVEHEEEIRVMAAAADSGSAANPGDPEQRDGDGRHCEAEQTEARTAAPDQVGADDEPDEQVERAGPGRPGEAVGSGRLQAEERGLDEPAEANAPGREPAGKPWSARLAEVGHGGLAVREEGRPKQQLSQRSSTPVRA